MPRFSTQLATDPENIIAAMTPGGIEAQERRGQMHLASSSRLPKSGVSRETLELMGIKCGDDADDLFMKVTLPPGWRIEPTDHSMWSNLLDEQGRERASIFYKAAFYDRSAFIRLSRRYSVETYEACKQDGSPTTSENPKWYKATVRDAGKPIHTIGVRKADDYEEGNRLGKLGQEWLSEHYPTWTDELSYWTA